jgi:hypothetical protein
MSMTGTRGGVDWPPVGGILEVSDEEGAQLCGVGIAIPVAEKPADKVEKAVAPEAEERGGALTTDDVPQVKRGPGRPRKNP